jgi:choline monooxygenase
MNPLYVNPDISQAKTIDKAVYLDAGYFAAAKEKIFARSWQYLGDADEVAVAESVAPVQLLEGYLNEPLVLSRDKAGGLHCLSNVCTHRGNMLVEKPGAVKDIRCRYHGRRFELNGRFQSMPEFKEVQNFPSEADHLAQVSHHQFGKWLFASLHPAFTAAEAFGDMATRVGWMPLHQFTPRPDLSHTYTVKANWALYCENYLEGFHIPFVHAGLNAVIDYGNYTTELFPYASLQLGLAKPGEPCFNLPVSSPDYGKQVAGYYFWVFPNLMFNFYPWGLSINVVCPVDVATTQVRFLSYVWDESKLDAGAGGALHEVELEDEDIVQHVQQGIRSRFYAHGRYSVTRETGTHHFHRLLADFLNRP